MAFEFNPKTEVLKVKEFVSYNGIERPVNQWLAELSYVRIIDIKYSSDGGDIIALVVYVDTKEEK